MSSSFLLPVRSVTLRGGHTCGAHLNTDSHEDVHLALCRFVRLSTWVHKRYKLVKDRLYVSCAYKRVIELTFCTTFFRLTSRPPAAAASSRLFFTFALTLFRKDATSFTLTSDSRRAAVSSLSSASRTCRSALILPGGDELDWPCHRLRVLGIAVVGRHGADCRARREP